MTSRRRNCIIWQAPAKSCRNKNKSVASRDVKFSLMAFWPMRIPGGRSAHLKHTTRSRCHQSCLCHFCSIDIAIMSLAPQYAVRRCAQCLRSSQAQTLRFAAATAPARRRQQESRRWQSTEAALPSSTNPKISGIVDQISQLTLLETADLVSTLKVLLKS